MRIVRIASLAIALCAASASIAAAQRDTTPPGARPRGMMGGRLLDGITLTDAQQAQLKVIREKYMPKMQALRDSLMSTGAPPDSAARAKMMTMNASYSAEVRAILTPDQQAIYDKNVADQRNRPRPPPPSGN